MSYKILADIIVFIHFLWIVFLIFGVFLGIKYKIARMIHISGLVFALVIQVFHWFCPLTHLEFWLRTKHYPNLSYPGSFIIHYVEKIVYLELSRNLIFILSILLLAVNLWLYLKKRRRWR